MLNFKNMLNSTVRRTFPVDHVHYLLNMAGRALSPLCNPGWCLEFNFWNTMYGLNLRVSQQVCGNVLYLLAVESGIALDKAL